MENLDIRPSADFLLPWETYIIREDDHYIGISHIISSDEIIEIDVDDYVL